MTVIKSNAAVFPIGGQGLGGKTTHAAYCEVLINAASVAAGDTMTVAHLPTNALLTGMAVKHDNVAALTFSLGTASNASLIRASAALAQGVTDRAMADAGVFSRTTLYPTTPVVATFGATSAITAGSKIYIVVHYIVDEPTTAA